ncbi:hypothetical protein [Methylobacterium sp. A54F]
MTKFMLGCAALSCVATGAPRAAEVRLTSYGCKSLLAAEQLLNPGAADTEGHQDRLKRLVRAGECRLWQTGETVSAEAESDGFTCFARTDARNICYWSANSLTR